MGLLDNDTVIVDAILTKAGRRKLSQGQPLNIQSFAFGDTGVDYTLYNPNHPNGSSDYGSAITSMPQMEAVPHEMVFMRSKLFGTGPRDSQTYSHIQIPGGPFTIEQSSAANSIESQEITITPNLNPADSTANFTFRILDGRGLIINGDQNLTPDFSYPDVTPITITGLRVLKVNAKAGQITSNKTVGLEVRRDGSAPAMTTIQTNTNATAA
tara:strand:+ start:54 stop:689 length:636 start_codon:yes stop_codon:yes gene_type:complete